MKIIEVLHEWPLSKVELIEVDGQPYILKTVHKDFAQEINRQQTIRFVAQDFIVPRILEQQASEETVQFVMDYYPTTREATDEEAVQLLKSLHASFDKIEDQSAFVMYSIDQLSHDVAICNQYLTQFGSSLQLQDRDFIDLFDQVGIIHGDWGKDQIIISGDKRVVIDFGKAMIAPRILDYAHGEVQGIASLGNVPAKAKVLVYIMRIAWFDVCKRSYIDYSYEQEMRDSVAQIEVLM